MSSSGDSQVKSAPLLPFWGFLFGKGGNDSGKLGKWGFGNMARLFWAAGTATVPTLLFSFDLLIDALKIILLTSPVWLILKMAPTALRHYWLHYIQHQFLDADAQKGVLLEILLPAEMEKSPKAMEVVFDNLHFRMSMGSLVFNQRFKGVVPHWYSFEIESREGRLHLYVWCWKRIQDRVEAVIYSQYPDVRIIEMEDDYAKRYDYDRDDLQVWGCNLKLSKDDAYPLRTYLDYELERDPREEQKVDPLVTILEYMGSVGPGEHLWVQILCMLDNGNKQLAKSVDKAIADIYESVTPKYKGKDRNGKEIDLEGYAQLQPMQFELIKSMERSTEKQSFQTGIRVVYATMPGKFRPSYTQVYNMFRGFSSPGSEYYNNLSLDGETYLAGFDWPWEFAALRKPGRTRALLDAYRTRSYFHPPHKGDPFILTSEELATLFHPVGAVAQVPGLQRLPSKRSAAPVNLPM